MKILKFNIKNYKSIVDTEDCYLTDNITILAGKNESGKTSILEALEDFDVDKKIRDVAIPISTELEPQITVTFEMDKEELDNIAEDAGINITTKKINQITLIKTYPDKYSLDTDSLKLLTVDTDNSQQVQNEIKEQYETLKKIADKYPNISQYFDDINFSDFNEIKTQLTTLNQQIENDKATITDPSDKENLTTGMTSIIQKSSDLINNNIEKIFIKKFTEEYMFNMVLFSSFDDEFPHTIPLSELANNEWANDLANISDFSIEAITGSDARAKKQHKTKINIEFKGKFQKYWTQDPITLEVDWNSQEVEFWIEEDGNYYEPKQRSKGQQWHLAYYVKVGARAREDVPNIILIDEPGLYLHAKAQRDVIKSLEDHSADTQVIFSTHSPYLIEADKLNRVRLIEKGNKGTKIYNKLHALADKETLTPVLTAIGLGLNDGIQNIAHKHNIVVEGPADVFYFQAFKLLTEKDASVNFLCGGGSGNMPFIGSIIQGWGGRVAYLFDNDQAKKDGKKNLTKNWYVSADLIMSVLDNKSGAIEDILSTQDYKNYVLGNDSLKYETKNSEYVKKSKKDKVLLSKLFLQKVEDDRNQIQLDKESVGNINDLLDKCSAIFNL